MTKYLIGWMPDANSVELFSYKVMTHRELVDWLIDDIVEVMSNNNDVENRVCWANEILALDMASIDYIKEYCDSRGWKIMEVSV